MKQHHWHHHPAVKSGSELSLGDRAADVMRNAMGSWPFVFSFLATMLAWAVVNTIFLAKVVHQRPFDPYPYILLNLILSTLAGLQGAILLIAAKRADAIAAQVAINDYEADQRSEKMLEDITIGFADMKTQHTKMADQLHRIHQHIIPDTNPPEAAEA